jgi:four helix bundle protein
MKYDLEDRTLEFGKNIIKFCQALTRNTINNELVRQLVKSGTSIGANYREANGAESKKDFTHKIGISLKEAKETQYWLKLILETNIESQKRIELLLKESLELIKIFSSISKNSKS